MKSVYIETTIPSYATGKISSNIIVAGKQTLTNLFWERERHKYELFTSQYTIDECKFGDLEAAKKRIAFLNGVQILPKSSEIAHIAMLYQKILAIPEKAKMDCFHLAVCVAAHIDFLLSWNCAHLGVITYSKIKTYNDMHGLWTPLLTTPEPLIEILEDE